MLCPLSSTRHRPPCSRVEDVSQLPMLKAQRNALRLNLLLVCTSSSHQMVEALVFMQQKRSQLVMNFREAPLLRVRDFNGDGISEWEQHAKYIRGAITCLPEGGV